MRLAFRARSPLALAARRRPGRSGEKPGRIEARSWGTMWAGMRSRSDSLAWKKVFAAGLLLRPILIVPMAPSGPLGGSILLPIGLAAVFALRILLAAGVFVGSRPAIALAIITALAGLVLAAVGACLGLPMPWPLALAGYNIALAAVGIKAWWELRVVTGG